MKNEKELPIGITKDNCVFLKVDEEDEDDDFFNYFVGYFMGNHGDNILYFNFNNVYYHFDGNNICVSDCRVVDLDKLASRISKTKVKEEDFIRENNLYRNDNIMVMQVPHILAGVSYKLNATEDELYNLRRTDRERYDKISEDMKNISKTIGEIALKAAKEIEELVLDHIENM